MQRANPNLGVAMASIVCVPACTAARPATVRAGAARPALSSLATSRTAAPYHRAALQPRQASAFLLCRRRRRCPVCRLACRLLPRRPCPRLALDLPPTHVQVRQPAAPRAAAGDAPAAAAAAASGHGSGRHAFLHDFCMCIPYGALLLAGGLVAKLFGWGQPAVVMAVIGALQVGRGAWTLVQVAVSMLAGCCPYVHPAVQRMALRLHQKLPHMAAVVLALGAPSWRALPRPTSAGAPLQPSVHTCFARMPVLSRQQGVCI